MIYMKSSNVAQGPHFVRDIVHECQIWGRLNALAWVAKIIADRVVRRISFKTMMYKSHLIRKDMTLVVRVMEPYVVVCLGISLRHYYNIG